MEEAHRVQQIVDRNCSLNSVKASFNFSVL